MKTIIGSSDYIKGRYNTTKLDKLESELKKVFSTLEKHYPNIPLGVEVKISMSAKYQYTYIHVSNWGEFQEVGLLEDAVNEALENRGFEVSELDGEDDYFTISFE